VPGSLRLPVSAARTVLACGADLKSTFCVAHGDDAVLSAHLGDLADDAARDAYEDAVAHLCRLLGREPEVVAHDLHPDYASTRLGRDLASRCGLDTVAVQHHHAHVAAVMAEHGRVAPVIGVAYDGLGLGPDGTLWGGELLLADLRGATRLAHLAPLPMPGGVAAIREPWRMLAAHLDAAGVDPGRIAAVVHRDVDELLDLARRGVNSPLTSGMGRLFDAVGALVTGRWTVGHEAQAAIELQHLVPPDADPHDRYPWVASGSGPAGPLVLGGADLVAAVLDDLTAGTSPPTVAARFHHSVAAATVDLVGRLREQTGVATVALSGGVMQNRVLLVLLERGLTGAGHQVLSARRVPPHDGAISLGQATVAAARLAEG
jgi:hydrogenase maturation protein HypF